MKKPAKAFRRYSWAQLNKAAIKLAEALRSQKLDGRPLVTFTRGGAFTAAMIANHLPWKAAILSLPDNFLDRHKRGEWKHRVQALGKAIVVDDILDTGNTMVRFCRLVDGPVYGTSQYEFAFLLDKPGEHRLIDMENYHFGRGVPAHEWSIFPWEVLRGEDWR